MIFHRYYESCNIWSKWTKITMKITAMEIYLSIFPCFEYWNWAQTYLLRSGFSWLLWTLSVTRVYKIQKTRKSILTSLHFVSAFCISHTTATVLKTSLQTAPSSQGKSLKIFKAWNSIPDSKFSFPLLRFQYIAATLIHLYLPINSKTMLYISITVIFHRHF